MKNVLMILFISFMIVSCSPSHPIEEDILSGETDLFQETFKTLMNEIDSIPSDMNFLDGKNDFFVYSTEPKEFETTKIDSFYHDYIANESSQLIVISHTIEGDPIISNVLFEKDRFYVVVDHRRDVFGSPYIFQGYYNYMFVEELDGLTVYYLSKDKSFSYKDYHQNIEMNRDEYTRDDFIVLATIYSIE